MKNKGVNILAILAGILVVAVIGVALFLVLRAPKDDQSGEIMTGISGIVDINSEVLKLENIQQFRTFAENGGYECYLGDDLSGGSIYKVRLLGEETIVTYYFDDRGNTMDFEAFYLLNADVTAETRGETTELTVEQLAASAEEAVGQFCLMFGCNFVPELYLTNYDGTFTLVENDADFQSLMDGNADLRFSIRAQDGFFWEMNISCSDGLASVNVRKYFNIDQTKDYIANISLYEEEWQI